MTVLDFTPATGAAPGWRRVLRHGLTESRLLLRNGEQLLLALAIPVGILLVGRFVGGRFGDLGVLAPSVMALAIWSSAFTSLAIATGFERRYGVLERLAPTPLGKLGLLAGKALSLVLIVLGQLLVLGGVAAAVGWRPQVSLPSALAMLLLIVLGVATFAGLGLALAGRLRAETTLGLANLVYVLLLALGGLVLPVARYPALLQPVISVLPTAALGEGLRAGAAGLVLGWPFLVLVAWLALSATFGLERVPMGFLNERRPTALSPLRAVQSGTALRRWAVASLAVNVLIVVTGALVRLTDSGLGCPTWPRCSELSYVTHPELGYHGLIEFGNRLLTFVLVIVAVLTWLTAMLYREHGRPRTDLLRLTTILALGIPAQAVLGGITVLTDLNPFVVALHLLVSFVLITLSVLLVRRTRALVARPVRPGAAALTKVTFVVMWVVVWLGTVVTGSGPHAGDEQAVRTGLDPVLVTHVHAIGVYLVVATTLACVALLRSRAALALLGIEIAQAAIGIAQYHLGLPVWLVLLHLLGAALSIALATNLMLSVRTSARDSGSAPASPSVSRPLGSRSVDTHV